LDADYADKNPATARIQQQLLQMVLLTATALQQQNLRLPLQFTKPFAVAVAVSVPFPGFIRVIRVQRCCSRSCRAELSQFREEPF
jgi:hypothetical protein